MLLPHVPVWHQQHHLILLLKNSSNIHLIINVGGVGLGAQAAQGKHLVMVVKIINATSQAGVVGKP